MSLMFQDVRTLHSLPMLDLKLTENLNASVVCWSKKGKICAVVVLLMGESRMSMFPLGRSGACQAIISSCSAGRTMTCL